MWVLGTEYRSSARVANALNCWAMSLAPSLYLKDGIRKYQEADILIEQAVESFLEDIVVSRAF